MRNNSNCFLVLKINIFQKAILVTFALLIGCINGSSQMFTTSFSSSMGSSNVYEFDAVDIRPEFPGGERALINFINGEKKYPADAYANGIEGRVLVSFIICTDGSVSNAGIVRGVEDSLNREALRVVGLMPRWTPGKVNGASVNVRHVITIVFRI